MDPEQLSSSIAEAARLIRAGKVVAFPTETVYGLGANALDPDAVVKIYELKERPSFDPLIIHIADAAMLKELTTSQDPRIDILAAAFWPGPLTLILPKSTIVPDIVTSGLSTVGIRMPGNNIARELILQSGCPIAAPSANKFGRISPTRAEHVKKQLPGVDYILDGGSTMVGIESTIIRLTNAGFQMLRPGVITRSDIEMVIPHDEEMQPETALPLAPGMIKSHYSPQKAFYILGEENTDTLPRGNAGFISFSGIDTEGYRFVEYPSPEKDLKEYAVNIFAAMHRLEEADISHIVAEPVPDQGIGLAIMDRLRKAAFKYRKNPAN